MFEWMDSILAARRKDSDSNLIEIVIFVAIAVVYALGGILKMRSGEKKSEKEHIQQTDETMTRRYKPLKPTVETPPKASQTSRRTLPYMKKTNQARAVPPQARRDTRIRQQREQQPQRTVRPKAEEVIKKILKPIFEPQKPAERPQRQPRPSRPHRAAKRPQMQKPADAKARRDLAYAKAAKTPKAKKPAAAVSEPTIFVSLGHLSQPDNLKMAIVYAEILGQPIGLRDM